ncbi:hypothetical protein ACLOJK_011198 [Asimina triloba]
MLQRARAVMVDELVNGEGGSGRTVSLARQQADDVGFNGSKVMVASRFENGDDQRMMEASSPAMKGRDLSLLAAAGDVALRSRRIGNLLDVTNKMDDSDYLTGCSL